MGLGNNLKIKRSLAGIMAFVMLLLVIFSVSYIMAHSDHTCSGRSCPVCFRIEECVKSLRQINRKINIIHIRLILPVTFFLSAVYSYRPDSARESLVSKMVRLDN